MPIGLRASAVRAPGRLGCGLHFWLSSGVARFRRWRTRMRAEYFGWAASYQIDWRLSGCVGVLTTLIIRRPARELEKHDPTSEAAPGN